MAVRFVKVLPAARRLAGCLKGMMVMMTKRQEFIHYVKNGGERLMCSPQIGGGAGYDTKLYGKEWNSEGRQEYTVEVTQRYPMVPLYNVGLDPVMHCGDKLKWVQDEYTESEGKRTYKSHCDTPFGTMYRHADERPHSGGFHVVNAINDADDFDKLEYVIDTALSSGDFSCYTRLGKEASDFYGDKGAVSVQWCMQPYEMLGYPSTLTTVFLAQDDEERFIRLMDKILELDYQIIDALAPSGIDFVFLGGPGAELISPSYYEKYLVPYSKKVTDYAHERGLLIYSHICSPIEPMLSMGYYNQMGIDLFETLSPAPEGNIQSLSDALSKIDPKICTRGNVSMSLLINGTPEMVEKEVFAVIDAAKGRKHMVAASDYLMYEVPEENVIALCSAVEKYYNK